MRYYRERHGKCNPFNEKHAYTVKIFNNKYICINNNIIINKNVIKKTTVKSVSIGRKGI